MILIVSPNNPTGSVLNESDFYSLKNTLKNYNIPLVIDEVFSDYVYGEDLHKTLTDSDIPVITVNGLSKILGLPGMKLSWILLSGPKFWKQKAKEYLELISDTYLSVNTPVQNVLSDLLQWKNLIQSQITKRIQRNLSFLKRILNDVNISKVVRCDFPNAGWYCVLESEKFFPEEEFSLRLLKEKKSICSSWRNVRFSERKEPGKNRPEPFDGNGIVRDRLERNSVESFNSTLELVQKLSSVGAALPRHCLPSSECRSSHGS
ncbi:aminotransferase, class I/II domain protein [Leptospira borgpetersenii serovar Pomona str. 200901868]|uniref:Aminotransferase, class I/II domain protein n=1 Tax=Leptospira borgpetersenii serovar Pomona str. 200901868 TaxID=1192866 RepID=M6W926_LEPBO|nr:aminotransferase, class I/II domain protein [Leptospira borgpetersenii serovar Pomona str. 200901868]